MSCCIDDMSDEIKFIGIIVDVRDFMLFVGVLTMDGCSVGLDDVVDVIEVWVAEVSERISVDGDMISSFLPDVG